MKAVTAAIAVLAMLALCLVPVQGVDADYADISGDSSVIGVGDDADFQIIYTNNDYDITEYQDFNMSISYDAKLTDSSGETVSNGVSPSSGDLESGTAQTLTVSAPDTAGRYTLQVEITVDATYTSTDEDGNETTEDLEIDLGVVRGLPPWILRPTERPPSSMTGSPMPATEPTRSVSRPRTVGTWSRSPDSVRLTRSTSVTTTTPGSSSCSWSSSSCWSWSWSGSTASP